MSVKKENAAGSSEVQKQAQALEAAAQGNLLFLRVLLAGADGAKRARARDAQGDTALHLAARAGHVAALQVLLETGVAADERGAGLRTPLHEAAAGGHADAVRLLLKFGASSHTFDFRGTTALCHAVRSGRVGVVRLLLDAGALINATCKDGLTPLHIAASAGSDDIVTLLVERGANAVTKDARGWTPLVVAAAEGRVEAVHLLLRRVQNRLYIPKLVPLEVKQALCAAGSAGVVWALAQAGPNVLRGEEGVKALSRAAEEGRADALGALLAAGVSANFTALHDAARGGHVECARQLLAAGADVGATFNGETPLHVAARGSKTALAQLLLRAGADVNATNQQGKTPSQLAATDEMRALLAPPLALQVASANNFTSLFHCSSSPMY